MPETELAELEGSEAAAYAAKEVQQFLAHHGLHAAFAATEARIVATWKRSGNPLEREMAWHKLQAFTDLKTELRGFAERRPVLDKS